MFHEPLSLADWMLMRLAVIAAVGVFFLLLTSTFKLLGRAWHRHAAPTLPLFPARVLSTPRRHR